MNSFESVGLFAGHFLVNYIFNKKSIRGILSCMHYLVIIFMLYNLLGIYLKFKNLTVYEDG